VPKVHLPGGKPTAQLKKTGDALHDQHLELVATMNADLASVPDVAAYIAPAHLTSFAQLKASLAACSAHCKGLAQPALGSAPSFDSSTLTREPWSLGDLASFPALASEVEQRVAAAQASARGQKKGIAELQGQLLKGAHGSGLLSCATGIRRTAHAKKEECARYVKAKTDPEVAKKIRVRALGPEQAENQRRLRRSSQVRPICCAGIRLVVLSAAQTVNDALSAVEVQLVRLKDRITEEELGRPGFRCAHENQN
jgi:hypothetical protein